MSYEWPLLIFTFLAEVAVGAFIGGGCAKALGLAAKTEPKAEADGKATPAGKSPLFAAFFGCCTGVLAVGLLASMLHLGSLIGAPLALGNLGASWLSREILTGILTLAGMAVTAALAWKVSDAAATIAWVITVVVSFIFLVCAGSAYQMATIPYWNTLATPLGLIIGALVAGGAVTAAFALVIEDGRICRAFPFAAAGAIAFCLFGFTTALGFGEAAAAGTAGVASVAIAAGQQMPLLAGQMLCGAIGAALQLASVRPERAAAAVTEAGGDSQPQQGNRKALAIAGCVLIIVALLMARMTFYSAAVNLQY